MLVFEAPTQVHGVGEHHVERQLSAPGLARAGMQVT